MVSGQWSGKQDGGPPVDNQLTLATVLDESVEESFRYGFRAGVDL